MRNSDGKNLSIGRSFTAFFFFLVFSINTSACSLFGLTKEIQLPPHSAELEGSDIKELAGWFIDWRDKRGVDLIWIFTNSIKDDAQSSKLAQDRMKNIEQLLSVLNTGHVPIKLVDDRSASASGPRAFSANRVKVAAQPACEKTGTCCGEAPGK